MDATLENIWKIRDRMLVMYSPVSGQFKYVEEVEDEVVHSQSVFTDYEGNPMVLAYATMNVACEFEFEVI